MTQIKEELNAAISVAFAVQDSDATNLEKGNFVKLTADLEVGSISGSNDDAIGYVLVPNKETGGDATIFTRGKYLASETTGAAYALGAKVCLNSAGKVIGASGVRATGTITVVDYSAMATSTITVNGVVLTNGTTFTAATDNDVTAKLIADAINVRVPGVRAYATAAVVTVEALDLGAAANLFTLATNMAAGTALVSGATLSGGKELNAAGIALEASTAADQTKQVLWY